MNIPHPDDATLDALEAASTNYHKIREWISTDPPVDQILQMFVIEHDRKAGPRAPVVQALVSAALRVYRRDLFDTVAQLK